MIDEILTLFYDKNTGLVKCFCSGKQTLDYYGPEKQYVEPYMDFIYVKYNEFLINNFKNYRVINGKVELIQPEKIEII